MNKVIGICGGSGSGKSTLVRRIKEELGSDKCLLLEQDHYYHDLIAQGKDPAQINFDHPSSLDLQLFHQHLIMLSRGNAIERPVYDLCTHRRKSPGLMLKPAEYIITDGLFLFQTAEFADIYSFRLFLELAEEERLERRLKRDIKERNRSETSVKEQFYRDVVPMHDAHVERQKRVAHEVWQGKGYTEHDIQRLAGLIRQV